MLALIVQHQSHGAFAHFRETLFVALLRCSTFSGVGAAGRPGAVQVGMGVLRDRIEGMTSSVWVAARHALTQFA